jgi:hypothetical protein
MNGRVHTREFIVGVLNCSQGVVLRKEVPHDEPGCSSRSRGLSFDVRPFIVALAHPRDACKTSLPRQRGSFPPSCVWGRSVGADFPLS